jgi:hypothetical protein
MTPTRHRNAWIWVAITAIALASVARVESGFEIARAYANPVIALLAATPGAPSANAQHFAAPQTKRGDRANSQHSGPSFWLELLPVLFVGLLSPLALLSARSLLSLDQAFPTPALPSLFQRPPPQLL